MKKLFKLLFLAAGAVAGAACEDKDQGSMHTTCPVLDPEQTVVEYIDTVIQESRALGLEAEEFASILCGKQWRDEVYVQYDADWTNLKVIYATINGEQLFPMAPGFGCLYTFEADGTGFDHFDTVQSEGGAITWSWDPVALVLDIDYADGRGLTLHIQSFSQEDFVGYEHRIFSEPEQHRIHQYLFKGLGGPL